MLVFLGLNPKGPYLSLEKEKENCTYFISGRVKLGSFMFDSNNPQKRSHHVDIRAFLHGDGGPQVGEVTRLSI